MTGICYVKYTQGKVLGNFRFDTPDGEFLLYKKTLVDAVSCDGRKYKDKKNWKMHTEEARALWVKLKKREWLIADDL